MKNELAKIRRIDLFTNGEASEILRVSAVTLWRERKAGRIAFRRIGGKLIYALSDLQEYLERQKRPTISSDNNTALNPREFFQR